jgi:hypothetical protein
VRKRGGGALKGRDRRGYKGRAKGECVAEAQGRCAAASSAENVTGMYIYLGEGEATQFQGTGPRRGREQVQVPLLDVGVHEAAAVHVGQRAGAVAKQPADVMKTEAWERMGVWRGGRRGARVELRLRTVEGVPCN